MNSILRENLVEALVGLLVVMLAVWFIIFAWERTGGDLNESIQVTALFPAANGVSAGTDVRVAGLKVGTVASQRLNPESYQAELVLSLDKSVKIPSDSSAAITAEGLLGGTYIALIPGGSDVPLKQGDMIMGACATGSSVCVYVGVIGAVTTAGAAIASTGGSMTSTFA